MSHFVKSQCSIPVTPSYTITQPSCNSCCDGSISLSIIGGCSPYQTQINNVITIPENAGLCSGSTYTLTINDNNCCPYNSFTIQPLYNNSTALNYSFNSIDNELFIVDNSFDAIIKIHVSNSFIIRNPSVYITNIIGEILLHKQIKSNELNIYKDNLPNGVYLLTITDGILKKSAQFFKQ